MGFGYCIKICSHLDVSEVSSLKLYDNFFEKFDNTTLLPAPFVTS